jgi:subtilisin family serine protease
MVRSRSYLMVALVAVVSLLLGVAAQANPGQGRERAPVIGADRDDAIEDRYIVVFRDDAPAAQRRSARNNAMARSGARLHFNYEAALRGFAATMPSESVEGLRRNPNVAFIEADYVVELAQTQSPTPSWGLDRIDQRDLPLDNSFTYSSSGAGVDAYVIDTGLQLDHPDFGGRAVTGFDAVTSGGSASDCHGHGTHVGGTIGGSDFGVAKNTRLIAVRVLNCQGGGTTSQIVAGINWVIQHHQPGQPAVANMSLGGGTNNSIDTATRNMVNDGVATAVAAGNSTANACNFSPARVAEALTVAASTISDARASFSNGGPCVDIFAPGQGITSAWLNGGTNTISGTSMAAPHVAGVAAQFLELNPGASPAQTGQALRSGATQNKVSGATFQSCVLIIILCSTVNTPNNHLLFTDL